MKDKTEYTPREAAIAVLDKIKELAKGEHNPKNLKELKDSFDTFVAEEGMEKSDPMAVKGAPKMGASTAVGAPTIPKAPAVPKMPKPMAKWSQDRMAKLGKAQAPANGGPEPKKESNPGEGPVKNVKERDTSLDGSAKQQLKGQPHGYASNPKMEKSGEAFKKLEHKVEKEGYSEKSAKAIAASAGRKSMGKEAFQAKAAAGKKHG